MIKTDIVLLGGYPASGKTEEAQKYIAQGYRHLSKDVEKTTDAKFQDIVQEAIDNKEKIVIDNTLLTIESRDVYVQKAKKAGVTIGVHFKNISMEDTLINSFERCYQRHGEVYFHSSDVPDDVKKNFPNSYIVSGIFKLRKEENPKKLKKSPNFPTLDQGLDDLQIDKFVRRAAPSDYTNKAIFVDLDGTVRETISGDKYPTTIHDVQIDPVMGSKLHEWAKKGYKIIAVTNQSGVNKGDMTLDECYDIVKYTDKQLGYVFDDYHICPHGATQFCGCRKPQSAAGIHFKHKYKLDLKQCIMIGDRTTDKTFATRLGMSFYYPQDFKKL